MTLDWESRFSTWAQPPGQTEADRIGNAIRRVRDALDADDQLRPLTKVYVQGSYRNRVNVRQDSDVDIGVLYTGSSFMANYPEGTTRENFGNIAGDYGYGSFKDRVGNALVAAFGSSAVSRGNKAFDVHANSHRVDADVVPVFEHRRYSADGSYICGVQLNPDRGGIVVNWPERLYDNTHWPSQHYENGVWKNGRTSKRYKSTVRILKKLRCTMADGGISAATDIPGFLVECLVWNVPDHYFERTSWDSIVQGALLHLWSNTKDGEDAYLDWGEVSELKYLFRGSPVEKRKRAHSFVDQAWSYVGVR